LHRCAYFNHPEIAGILIDAGADLNIQDTDGWTALHRCASWNHPEIAGILIDAGADKTIPTNSGKLPYELAESQELKELLKP
jgi:ankyrin repeat protein